MNTFKLAALAALLASTARADIKLPAILGNDMVLQQSVDARLWGWARPGEKVLISTSWSTIPAETVADDKGQWRATVKTPAADHKPHTITFKGDNEVTINNILFGEVWVCSGQSNMEWPFRASENAEGEIKSANHPAIRLFTVENTVSAEPRADCKGAWAAATPDTVKNFSAVGYYFGLNVNREINIPIGLIASDWGGTPAEAWTSAQGLAPLHEFNGRVPRPHLDKENLATAARLIDTWIKSIDAADPGFAGPVLWNERAFDDAAWSPVAVPGHWADANFDGLGWYRTTFDLPDTWPLGDAMLELGLIDDCDMTWLNGTLIGRIMYEGEGNWQTPRTYKVPAAALKPGRNTLAIRVLDAAGPGGLYGQPDQLVLKSSTRATIPLAGTWKFRATTPFASLPARPWTPATGVGAHTPAALYNGMIAPLTPLSIRGVIWYQGESNRDRAFQYRTLFPAMINDWRTRWSMPGNADFPFYFVQIAPFNYGGDKGEAAELREAQMLTLSVPNSGMAVTMDIGNPADIHPTRKKEVGRRLSLWAIAKTYGKSVECSGPTMKSFTVKGNAVAIAFDHATGLNSGDKPPSHFTIAGEDRKFVPAKAVIDGETVIISAAAIPRPVAVRFAWGAADEPDLKNGAGLPASSFRTDDWPGRTQKAPS